MSYNRLALILGDCLFPDHHRLNPDGNTLFFMAEDEGLCTHYQYHKHKLVFFLSAMRSHAEELQKHYPLSYWQIHAQEKDLSFEGKLRQTLSDHNISTIITYDIEDHFMDERVRRFCEYECVHLDIVDSSSFITTHEDFRNYLASVKQPFMHTFYVRQRKKFSILLDEQSKPLYGKWSFDESNRKKLPKKITLPDSQAFSVTRHTKDVIALVDERFAHHPGNTNNFQWATTREDAEQALEHFIKQRLANFGPYQDAFTNQQAFIFHSCLSPYLNAGLLLPDEVVDRAIAFAQDHDLPYESLEGFVRQVVGWREFMRGIYQTQPLDRNFFDHNRKLTNHWYDGTTGIPPLDDTIHKALDNCYLHHIERLMVMGNLMLLCKLHPREVYKWFMELFIDSADWVMAPNVLGMSQFADGGIVATKPYIAGSNYLLKMSNYSKGDWCETVDGLYWQFIEEKRSFFESNPRMGMMVRMLDKLDDQRKKRIFLKAEEFRDKVTS